MATIVDMVDYIIVLRQKLEQTERINEQLRREIESINNEKKTKN
jgi:hypothetical protein